MLSNGLVDFYIYSMSSDCIFRSTGFILEGFPRTPDEVRWLAESGYYPDVAITINSEDGDIIGRLLPPKMELWRAKRDR